LTSSTWEESKIDGLFLKERRYERRGNEGKLLEREERVETEGQKFPSLSSDWEIQVCLPSSTPPTVKEQD